MALNGMSSGPVELFVPGRVCLLGEHSDWAGGHRARHPGVHRGQCLVYGTNVGLHARASVASDGHFIYSTHMDTAPLRTEFTVEALDALARPGGFCAYVCGTAAVVLERFGTRVAAIAIDNYETTLPMRKGLSSSAAVCVLVTRAFDALFGLGLDVDAVMDVAYRGELRTQSQCGRMDQCCAFGTKFVAMVFDGESVTSNEVRCEVPMHFVVADLNAGKDTKAILRDLNGAYAADRLPSPDADASGTVVCGDDDGARYGRVRHFLGPVSWALVERGKAALAAGDSAELGRVFDEAQLRFDESLAPACAELRSPRLHEVLAHAAVRAHVQGGKGVGSQGDGSVQFVCADAQQQDAAAAALTELGCRPFKFTLGQGQAVGQ